MEGYGMENEMNPILGIGPEHSFAEGLTKKLRVGTVKQIKEVGELYKDNLVRPKFAVYRGDEEQINKWVEILNIICIEGFAREEFDDSIPEQAEAAVERFLFG
jgi:hypothetical protein